MFNFARCMNVIFNSLLVQLVKYDVHTTRKIIHTRHFFTYYYFAEQLVLTLWLLLVDFIPNIDKQFLQTPGLFRFPLLFTL